ncbi:hypothetical protein JOE59_000386 [Agromyces cerinus]|uniref:MSCRAMM family protein n=1 Tax=Agromyces cerinus TaxID=33878 RepID=UPI00195D9AB6|nr:hypothetical protein [Agromyces cerinus]MBM7829681.1 hypothetical protein [Agromyces cerinus]
MRVVAASAAGALVLTGVIAAGPAQASHPEVSLTGSNFEIDTNANLVVDDPAPSIDWAGVTENRKADLATGSGDDSFGQGSKEDTPVPSVVDGSIPPNKSDLKNFGTYLETVGSTKYLHMFWHRVQDPSGTTNMDFEFNQSPTISGNNVTPVRTAGDLLIQYDLSQGGTNPVLFVSRWVTAGAGSQCAASNAVPCWSTRTNLTSAGFATGSINTTPIAAGAADGLGSISARTFGEASVNFTALTGGLGSCVSFGSAYLKSRSSDSFSAAMKDFIAPAPTNISNCGSVTIRKQTLPDEDPNVTSFGFTKSFTTSPVVPNTFNLTDDGVKVIPGVLTGQVGTVSEDQPPTGWDLLSIDCSASSAGANVTTDLANSSLSFNLASAADTVDCTFTNRPRGTIIIEKVTADGAGAFDFTSETLTPAAFTLTTTEPGEDGKDSTTFGDLTPGSYDVAETVPDNWNLQSATCDDGSDVGAIGVSAGETVTCTFINTREVGAIKIVKTRKHAELGSGDYAHPGVTFTVTGGGLAEARTVQTDENGIACVSGLVVSAFFDDPYIVTETVPEGYVLVGDNDQEATVVESDGDCDTVTSDATVSFKNMPLTDLTVSVDSQVDGGTFSSISCDVDGSDEVLLTDGVTDPSVTITDLQPRTVVCTIVIDP